MSRPNYTPRPVAWYTRHPDPPWGVECIICGVLASGLDKLEALETADKHALEVHQVPQPLTEEQYEAGPPAAARSSMWTWCEDQRCPMQAEGQHVH